MTEEVGTLEVEMNTRKGEGMEDTAKKDENRVSRAAPPPSEASNLSSVATKEIIVEHGVKINVKGTVQAPKKHEVMFNSEMMLNRYFLT